MTMRQLPNMDELLKMFSPEVHDGIRRIATLPGTTHIVVFENHQLDSSQCGMRSAVPVGPSRSIPDLKSVEGRHLNDLPSQRQYPTFYVVL